MISENGAADTNTLRSLNSEGHDVVPWKRGIGDTSTRYAGVSRTRVLLKYLLHLRQQGRVESRIVADRATIRVPLRLFFRVLIGDSISSHVTKKTRIRKKKRRERIFSSASNLSDRVDTERASLR